MFGKKHYEKSKLLMNIKKKNKSPNGVGLYDLNLNLLEKFILLHMYIQKSEVLNILNHKQKLSLYFVLAFFFFTLLNLYYVYIVSWGFYLYYFSEQAIAFGGQLPDNFFLFSVVPVKFYANADTYKVQILKENRSKSGIYQ